MYVCALKGRDRRTQAILPLRGKILNVEKCSPEKIYQNTELQSLISALGLGVKNAKFDVTALRYMLEIVMHCWFLFFTPLALLFEPLKISNIPSSHFINVFFISNLVYIYAFLYERCTLLHMLFYMHTHIIWLCENTGITAW
jgi:hypothetical protein